MKNIGATRLQLSLSTNWLMNLAYLSFSKKNLQNVCHYQGGSKMILSILSVKLLFKINKKG